MRNARVFISCGQRAQREINIGKSVEDHFLKRGFETYLAEQVHSSDGLTENIFKFINKSEYFVFIDFKREKVCGEEYRGSLFVNQEIGIATFLEMRGIGFVERGVKREGILEYQIYNAFPFDDGTEIIKALEKETKDWDVDSINDLKILYEPSATNRDVVLANDPAKPLSDWYHLEIVNRNKRKHALSCIGYVTKIKDLVGKSEYRVATNELVWSGIGDITVNIMAGATRELDAFLLRHDDNEIRFHQRPLGTTNPKFKIPNLPKGKYLIEYTIISSNFDTASQEFILDFQTYRDNLTFKETSDIVGNGEKANIPTDEKKQ